MLKILSISVYVETSDRYRNFQHVYSMYMNMYVGSRYIFKEQNILVLYIFYFTIQICCFIEELIKESGNENIVARELNLSSLTSVREFAQQINREESRLDVLIHNAGTADLFKKKVTEDGLEMTMGTNHYGPFLLTHLLIGTTISFLTIFFFILRYYLQNYFADLLKRSKPSRIIVVASGLYYLARLNLNNVNPTTTLPGYLYYVSKYANIVFTLELARRLEGSGVTANCLHPGLISTGIWKSVPPPFSWGLNFLLNTFCKTTEQGAQTTIHLAVSSEVSGISGKYFSDCRVSKTCHNFLFTNSIS